MTGVQTCALPISAEVLQGLLRAPVSSQSGFGIGLYQTSKLAEISGFALTLTRNEAGNVCFTLRGEVRGARAQAPAGASGARQA